MNIVTVNVPKLDGYVFFLVKFYGYSQMGQSLYNKIILSILCFTKMRIITQL